MSWYPSMSSSVLSLGSSSTVRNVRSFHLCASVRLLAANDGVVFKGSRNHEQQRVQRPQGRLAAVQVADRRNFSSNQQRNAIPLYRLVYFNTRGAAELTRYILTVANVPYDDMRYPLQATAAGFGASAPFVQDQQQGAFAVNMGKLPILQVLTPDGKAAVATLGQSHAMNRFLADRHGLLPSYDHIDDNSNDNNTTISMMRLKIQLQRAQIDAIYESVRDIKSDFLRTKRNTSEARTLWMQESLPVHLQKLEASLPPPNSKNNSPWVMGGPRPTLADVAIFSLLGTSTSVMSGSLISALDDLDPRPMLQAKSATKALLYPRLEASVTAMQELPSIQAWHMKRPDTFS